MSNLINTCNECFDAVLPRCPDVIIIQEDFTPDEALTLEIEDKFGNKYRIEDSSIYAGTALFPTDELPDGLMETGANVIFRIYEMGAYYCEDLRKICTFDCINVTFQNVERSAVICCPDFENNSTDTTDCPCEILEIDLDNDETKILSFNNPNLGKDFITLNGSATLVFPDISTVGNRGIEIYITVVTDGTLTLTPSANDAFSKGNIGMSVTSPVVTGNSIYIVIGSEHIWSTFFSAT